MFDERRERTAGEAAARAAIERAEERWPGYLATARRTTLNAHYTDPALIAPVWSMLRTLGLDDRHVGFEPGAGTGLWMGDDLAAPLHGAELDPVSAAIANHLAPEGSLVRHESLTESRVPSLGPARDGYDFVVGNVPFASLKPHAKDNPDRLALHNYATVKAASMVKPGGYLALLTSRYTLDAKDSTTRERLGELCELVGAVRLPTDAHAERAGTAVVTDLLVMRRLEAGQTAVWPEPTTIVVEDQPVVVSSHYVDHPEMVIGRWVLGGMRRDNDIRVLHDGVKTGAHVARLHSLLERVAVSAEPMAPHGAAPAALMKVAERGTHEVPLGSIVVNGAGFQRLTSEGLVDHACPKTQTAELRALIGLRDAVRSVLTADAAGADASAQRAELNSRYDQYASQFGPLNRFTVRTLSAPAGTIELDDDEIVPTRRVLPAMGGFRADPGWWPVAALEVFDEDRQVAAKAPIMSRPVLRTAAFPEQVDTAAEAVQVLMARDGRVDLAEVAALAGVDEADAAAWLGDEVFVDPESGAVTPAALYLSGYVRDKLEVAEAAVAAGRDDLARNVAALTAALPDWIPAEQITARLGAPWIPAEVVQQFIREELELPNAKVEYAPKLAMWSIEGRGYSARSDIDLGVPKRTGVELAEDIANQKLTRITMPIGDGRYALDPEATAAASAKRTEIEDSFAAWLWSNPDRADSLSASYNKTYNSYVEPRWDGQALSLDGMAEGFTPRPHQLDAVARVLGDRERGTLLAHAVGAGKTAVMAMASMELRRLGIASGPVAIVVPNSMLQQFGRELLQLYPTANILAADDTNFAKDRRREFVAKAASGAYDVVLFTPTSFTAIPASVETQTRMIDREVAAYREVLTGEGMSTEGKLDGRSVKRIETQIAQLEARLTKISEKANHDEATLSFEEMGIGHLMVDEAHLAKNLSFPTRIDAAKIQESGRARDLLTKVDWLRDTQGPGAITFATATPVTNHLAEMWVFQRFLDPAHLERCDMAHFDAWAANFARTVSSVEVNPNGSGFRSVERFSAFTNVPELTAAFRAFADVRTAEQLNLPRPAIAGGAAQTVTVDGGEELRAFMADLVERTENLRRARTPEPGEDNMLAIAGDGRVGALDLRLASRSTGFASDRHRPSPKVARAATEIAKRFHANAHREYLDPTGNVSPIRGSAQIVFIDHGVPGNPHRDVYTDLVDALEERGVPRGRVAMVQSAKTHEDRAALFRSVREGRVSVLIGSTASMGVGVNAQTRLIAHHQLTAPWRPDEVEQAEGRSLRQGNQNAEVEILRYISEGSYDAYSWQTIERKARFVAQVMNGGSARDVVDEAAVADEYAVLKAIATGDPRILAAAQLESKVTALERSHRVHEQAQRGVKREAGIVRSNAEQTELNAERLIEALTGFDRAGRIEVLNKDRDVVWSGTHDSEGMRAIVGARMIEALPELHRHYQGVPVLRVGGTEFQLGYSAKGTVDGGVALFVGEMRERFAQRPFEGRDLIRGREQGVGTAVVNFVDRIASGPADLQRDAVQWRRRLEELEPRVGVPFSRLDELVALRGELTVLQAQLMAESNGPEPTGVGVAQPTPASAPAPARPVAPQRGPSNDPYWHARAANLPWPGAVPEPTPTMPFEEDPERGLEL